MLIRNMFPHMRHLNFLVVGNPVMDLIISGEGSRLGAASVEAFTTGWDDVQMRHVLLVETHVEVPDDLLVVEDHYVVYMGLPIHSSD